MSKPTWRVYYSDTDTFDSTQGEPRLAPAWGVQAIVQNCPDEGKHTLYAFDYYWHNGERWCGGDFVGLLDFLSGSVGPVKFGRRIRPKEYERIVQLADNDPDFKDAGSRQEGPFEAPAPGG